MTSPVMSLFPGLACHGSSSTGRCSACVAQYFSWINHTNEGPTKSQTLANLAFFQWMYDAFGRQLDVYAFVSVVAGSRFESEGSPVSPTFQYSHKHALSPFQCVPPVGGRSSMSSLVSKNTWMTNPALPDALRGQWQRMSQGKRERGVLRRFNDDKLGMFIHWGLYSLPSGKWNGRDVWGMGE